MKKFTDFSWKKGGLWIVSSLVGAMAIIGLFLFTFFDSPKAFLQFLHDYQIIRTRYFRPVSDETLFQGAVKGMASSLGDPYSLYLTGDVYKLSLIHILNKLLEDENLAIVFITMQNPDDAEAAGRIIQPDNRRVFLVRNVINVNELMSVIGNMDVLVGMRLHALSLDVYKKQELMHGKWGLRTDICFFDYSTSF